MEMGAVIAAVPKAPIRAPINGHVFTLAGITDRLFSQNRLTFTLQLIISYHWSSQMEGGVLTPEMFCIRNRLETAR